MLGRVHAQKGGSSKCEHARGENALAAGSVKTARPCGRAVWREPLLKPGRALEEAQSLGAVADQHVLSLLIMLQHHLVRLTPDARLLVAAECSVCRIEMVAVGPDPARLDRPAEAISPRAVARPHAGAEAIKRVVCDGERFIVVLELRHRDHRAEDF